jgi:pimeloyl-ACP methyl ester carboxylesterase
MTAFADQVLALLDHLELEAPVVGGTSLGANVGLEFAARHPERAGGLFIEMPVLEDALLAAALIFTPVLLGLRFGAPLLRGIGALTRRIPRTNYLVDIALDWVRQDPEPSRAVLEGLLFGRTAPTQTERRGLNQPALVLGHPNDPLHPFSDADLLVEDMPNARLVDANSILEWRLTPDRLNGELAAFLDEVHATGEAEGERPAAPRAVSG